MWIALIVCSALSAAVAMLLGFHLLDQRDRRRTELIRDLLDSGEPELMAVAVRLALQASGGDSAVMRLSDELASVRIARLDVEIAALGISLAHLQASLPIVDGKLRASLRAVDSLRRKLP